MKNFPYSLFIEINDKKVPVNSISAGEYKVIESPVPANSADLKILLQGDRRLVILQTSFK